MRQEHRKKMKQISEWNSQITEEMKWTARTTHLKINDIKTNCIF